MKTFKEFLLERDEPIVNDSMGIHYSHKPELTNLRATMSGSGIKGAEQERLRSAKDDRIKKRVYFYPHLGSHDTLPRPEEGLGIHAYEAKLPNMFDARTHSKETNKISTKAKEYEAKGEHPSNAFESAVLDHGYHGYHTPNMSVVLNKDVPAKYIGSRIGKKFVDIKQDTTPTKHSVFESMPSKTGEHISSMLSNEQSMFFLKHKKDLQAAAPSLKQQYGRLNIHKDDLPKLQQELEKHKNHPF